MGLGVEYGCPFVLEGPDGSRAVFNDDSDPDFVGILNPEESSGLDSPDVREDFQVHTEADGGVQGNNYYGGRPLVLGGTIIASSVVDRNEKVSKLKAASNALRGDATLTWKPAELEGEEVELKLRRQQPLRVTKGYVKVFQVPMVAADIFPVGVELHTGGAGTLENTGDAPAYLTAKVHISNSPLRLENLSSEGAVVIEGEVFGALTALSPATVGTGDNPIATEVSPDGKSVYVANSNASTISQFSRAEDGKLTALSPATVATGETPFSVAVSPNGKSVYAPNANADTISQFSRAEDGKLTALSPATVAAGDSPRWVAISPDGKSVYVVNATAATISQFSRAEDGKLTALSPATVATGTSPLMVVVSPDGKSVYTVNSGASTISQFSRAEDGKLTALSPATVATGDNPRSIFISFDSKSVYTTNAIAATISQFSRAEDGKLTALSPATTAAASGGRGAISPNGKSVYSVNTNLDTISQFSRADVYYTVNFKHHTILKNDTTPAHNTLVFSESDWWALQPGENEISVSGGTAEFTWQDAYL